MCSRYPVVAELHPHVVSGKEQHVHPRIAAGAGFLTCRAKALPAAPVALRREAGTRGARARRRALPPSERSGEQRDEEESTARVCVHAVVELSSLLSPPLGKKEKSLSNRELSLNTP